MVSRSMIIRGAAALLAVCCAVPCAAQAAKWTAAAPLKGDGIVLTKGPGSEWKAVAAASPPVVELQPLNDYFKRASFIFRLERPAQSGWWLKIGFLDKGYGVVTVALGAEGKGVAQRDLRGVAILNSGKVRHAAFRLANGVAGRITVTGARFLESVEIVETEPPAEPLPEARPAFTLKRPMDLVMPRAPTRPRWMVARGAGHLRNQLPLVNALGFNGVESYVKWNFVERSPGVFDWSFYDAVVDEMERHGLNWFPLLIVGSAYALPDWFYESQGTGRLRVPGARHRDRDSHHLRRERR